MIKIGLNKKLIMTVVVITAIIGFIGLSHVSSANAEFADLVSRSNNFNKMCKFPTQANRIATIAGKNQAKQEEIVRQAHNVRPILHQRVLALIDGFIAHKKQFGSLVEQAFYKNMNQDMFIDRLLTNRPLEFMTEHDAYLLLNGQDGNGGFESIGTDAEKAPLILKDYLSYDEMQISALLGVSVPTYFINDGDRYNKGIPQYKNAPYQEKGIYVGLVGARFEKPGYMEWEHMMVTPEQNTAENGYGPGQHTGAKADKLRLWAQFYGVDYFPTFVQAQNDHTGRFVKIGNNYLDGLVYARRLRMVIEPFLADANQRAQDQKTQVYCRVVGLGLGVWAVDPLKQSELMMQVYKQVLLENNFTHIADIDFIHFKINSIGGVKSGGKIKTTTIHFSERNPATQLTGGDANKLLVALYAWDGNAYPGNEYWVGALAASGDPAAACCSTIPELQNPLINPAVSSKNLFVAP